MAWNTAFVGQLDLPEEVTRSWNLALGRHFEGRRACHSQEPGDFITDSGQREL